MSMSMEAADRLEKTTTIKANRSRVWQALTDSAQFGEWFRVKLDGPFVAGQPITGQITHPGYEHVRFNAQVERIEPETLFTFRWHPYAIDPNVDYSGEPATLVEFRLADAAEGTHLTVTESGFNAIPAERRDEAFRMNSNGWQHQMVNIKDYVEAQ